MLKTGQQHIEQGEHVAVTLCSMDRGRGCSGLLVYSLFRLPLSQHELVPTCVKSLSGKHGCLKQGITRGLKTRCFDMLSDERRCLNKLDTYC